MTDIATNIFSIKQKISALTTNNVQLLAVSKNKPISAIKQAFSAKQYHFGENYIQEALPKIIILAKDSTYSNIVWHFIGSIQSNKVKDIANNFSWVHSVDRFKIAKKLNDNRNDNLAKLNICLQINIDSQNTKSGISIDEVADMVNSVSKLDKISLRGFMCIPKKNNAKSAFARMLNLKNNYPQLDTLSMGMSNDMDIAIKYGANIVRIGTAIFGER